MKACPEWDEQDIKHDKPMSFFINLRRVNIIVFSYPQSTTCAENPFLKPFEENASPSSRIDLSFFCLSVFYSVLEKRYQRALLAQKPGGGNDLIVTIAFALQMVVAYFLMVRVPSSVPLGVILKGLDFRVFNSLPTA